MSNKALFFALIHSFDDIWNEGTDVLVLSSTQHCNQTADKTGFFASLSFSKSSLLMTFSKYDITYHLKYDVKRDNFLLNDRVLASGQYDQEFRLSLRWFFQEYKKGNLVLSEGIHARLKSKHMVVNKGSMGSSPMLFSDIDMCMVAYSDSCHICMSQPLVLNPLISMCSEFKGYHFFDARQKTVDRIESFDIHVTFSKLYRCDVRSFLEVA